MNPRMLIVLGAVAISLTSPLPASAASNRQCHEACRAEGLKGRDLRACVSDCNRRACVTDTDCRTFSDYCDGCTCRALNVDAPDPRCHGVIVQCFADPCMDMQAVCVDGLCELAPE